MNIKALGELVLINKRVDLSETEKARRKVQIDDQKKHHKAEINRLLSLLEGPQFERTAADAQSFLTNFGNLSFFKDYIQEGNKSLIRQLFLQAECVSYSKNMFITRKGDKQNKCFRLILEGQVGLYLEFNDPTTRRRQLVLIRKLFAGESIEIGSLLDGEACRMTTQALTEKVEVLTLSPQVFAATIQHTESEKYEADLNFLRGVPLFSAWPKQNLASLQMCITKYSVPQGQVIYRQGQPSHAIFIIKRGEFGQYKRRLAWRANEEKNNHHTNGQHNMNNEQTQQSNNMDSIDSIKAERTSPNQLETSVIIEEETEERNQLNSSQNMSNTNLNSSIQIANNLQSFARLPAGSSITSIPQTNTNNKTQTTLTNINKNNSNNAQVNNPSTLPTKESNEKLDMIKKVAGYLAGSVIQMNSELVNVYTVFDSFGEKELLGKCARQFSMVCRSETGGELIQIKSRDFFVLAQESPALKYAIMCKMMVESKKEEISHLKSMMTFSKETELSILDRHLHSPEDNKSSQHSKASKNNNNYKNTTSLNYHNLHSNHRMIAQQTPSNATKNISNSHSSTMNGSLYNQNRFSTRYSDSNNNNNNPFSSNQHSSLHIQSQQAQFTPQLRHAQSFTVNKIQFNPKNISALQSSIAAISYANSQNGSATTKSAASNLKSRNAAESSPTASFFEDSVAIATTPRKLISKGSIVIKDLTPYMDPTNLSIKPTIHSSASTTTNRKSSLIQSGGYFNSGQASDEMTSFSKGFHRSQNSNVSLSDMTETQLQVRVKLPNSSSSSITTPVTSMKGIQSLVKLPAVSIRSSQRIEANDFGRTSLTTPTLTNNTEKFSKPNLLSQTKAANLLTPLNLRPSIMFSAHPSLQNSKKVDDHIDRRNGLPSDAFSSRRFTNSIAYSRFEVNIL